MSLGHQLVKEQLFFRRELRERSYWFIKLRWIAVAGGFGGIGAIKVADLQFSFIPLTLIMTVIFFYNTLFLVIWLRLRSLKSCNVTPFEVFVHTQIFFDLIALFFLISFTGAIHSPLLLFTIFHIILAGILLSTASCFIYSSLVVIAFGFMIMSQKSEMIPIQPILFQNMLLPFNMQVSGAFFIFLTLLAFIMISAFLITSIKSSLRTKGRELLKVSKELEISNTKLRTLYNMVKQMGSLYDLQPLIACATKNGAIIMGVKGCSIKLFDSQRKKIKISSMYGLSDNCANKDDIDIEKSQVMLKILHGERFSIGKDDLANFFEYPDKIQNEGVASMVCLPLYVDNIVSGGFCIYSDASDCFETEDLAFFSLMADLTALGIERITRDLSKRWFLSKAAHQLRSPLNAIYSMLEVIQKGYLGPINQEQVDSIERCEVRIRILGETINELLKIENRRNQRVRDAATLVDVQRVLKDLATLYESRGSQKRVNLKFDIDGSTPHMSVDRQLLDDLFSNLISNAIKYTPSEGDITAILSVEEDGRQIKFQVTDTGIGIPEQDLSTIFSEFFRSENAKTFTENGTGLGLTIVKEALETLGGSISVESKPGEGSSFTCRLPVDPFNPQ